MNSKQPTNRYFTIKEGEVLEIQIQHLRPQQILLHVNIDGEIVTGNLSEKGTPRCNLEDIMLAALYIQDANKNLPIRLGAMPTFLKDLFERQKERRGKLSSDIIILEHVRHSDDNKLILVDKIYISSSGRIVQLFKRTDYMPFTLRR